MKNEEERGYLVQVMLDKAEEVGQWRVEREGEGEREGGELIRETVRLLGVLVSARVVDIKSVISGKQEPEEAEVVEGREVRERIGEWIRSKMEVMQSRSGMELTRWGKGEFYIHIHLLSFRQRLCIPISIPFRGMRYSARGSGRHRTLSGGRIPSLGTVVFGFLFLLLFITPWVHPHPHPHQRFTPAKRTCSSSSMSLTPPAADMGPRWEDGGGRDGGGDGRCWQWGCKCPAIGTSFFFFLLSGVWVAKAKLGFLR